jgi:hypothetical protein
VDHNGTDTSPLQETQAMSTPHILCLSLLLVHDETKQEIFCFNSSVVTLFPLKYVSDKSQQQQKRNYTYLGIPSSHLALAE